MTASRSRHCSQDIRAWTPRWKAEPDVPRQERAPGRPGWPATDYELPPPGQSRTAATGGQTADEVARCWRSPDCPRACQPGPRADPPPEPEPPPPVAAL